MNMNMKIMNLKNDVGSYVAEITAMQVSLNERYNKKWMSEYSAFGLRVAMLDEFNEMCDEITHIHRFFGDKTKHNYAAALEEFIDIVHFFTTYAYFHAADPDGVSEQFEPTESDQKLYCLEFILSQLTTSDRNISLLQLLTAGCVLFDLTMAQMFCAYAHKNSKCVSRAEAGAAHKEIDKSKEVGTYQALFDMKLVFENVESYNERLYKSIGERYV